MVTSDQLIALLDAYRTGDRERFRGVAMQSIAGMRSERDKERARKVMSATLDDAQGFLLQALGTKSKELVYVLPQVELESLCLCDKLKSGLDSIIKERSKLGLLLKHHLPPRSRIMLYGPPGNGKTSIASALAVQAKLSGFGLLLSKAREGLLGATAAHLQDAFKLVESRGSLLFLDEFDAIGHTRINSKEAAGGEQNAIVATLLQLLDSRPQGIVVAATNRIDAVDPAILRRFDVLIEVPQPSNITALAFSKSVFERHMWPIGDWLPSDVSSFAAIERDAMNYIRNQLLSEVGGL